MARRVYLPTVMIGRVNLPPDQVHHVQHVLRLNDGDTVEAFDDIGHIAQATVRHLDHQHTAVEITAITDPPAGQRVLTIASAIPKGERADWMVEKLSELGAHGFIPLLTERSVVNPSGHNKLDRWARLAQESAKQSARIGTMRIAPVTKLADAVDELNTPAWVCATEVPAVPLRSRPLSRALTIFIGPEGGWSAGEIDLFRKNHIPALRLTASTLRIETAAITAAALLLAE